MNYSLHYSRLILRARLRIPVPGQYYEKHHAIPRCMGGDNTDLVKLTPEEHFLAHQLLVSIFPNEPKLVLACRMMTIGGSKNGDRTTNKMFGWIRKRFAAAQREMQTNRKLSAETKAKMSKSAKGRVKSEETRAKISAHRKGSKLSEESLAKVRENRKLRPKTTLSAESIAKRTATRKAKGSGVGHKMSPESIAQRTESRRLNNQGKYHAH